MKVFYASIILLLFTLGLSAQNYTRDCGIRFGNGLIGSYRQFYKEDMAIELYGGYLNRGFTFGGLREFFKPALNEYSDNFKLVYGYGVHTGLTYTNSHKIFNREYQYDWTLSPVFGMNSIAGIEYYFTEVPVVVSTTINPYFEFSLNRIFQLSLPNINFSVKYRF